jgi:ABC-type amino acid transport system permease subunit
LLATGITTTALFGAWTMLRVAGGVAVETYQSASVGLMAAALAHVLGIFGGAFLASAQRGRTAPMTAYLASTVIRFLCTPLLAVSLYFALPVKPQPLLIGAGAGYLLILVADIATMLKAMAGSAGSSPTPQA